MSRWNVERAGNALRQRPRLILAALFLFAAYAAAGFLLVPYLVRSAVETYVTQDLGRRVAIGSLTFNPFTFTFGMTDFALSEADGSPIASLDGLRLNFQLTSILYRAWTFKEVRLDRPDVSVLIDSDGSLNLAKLQPPRDTPQALPQPVKLPAVRISQFAVHGGRLAFEDRNSSRSAPFTATLTPIEFTLTDFRTAPDFQNAYNFEGSTLAGERLAWSGAFTVEPAGSTGRFAVENLQAATIARYLQDSLPGDLHSGSIDLNGEYRIALADQLSMNIDLPSVKLHDVSVAPKNIDAAGPWITLPALEIENTILSWDQRRISVSRVLADDAHIEMQREADGSINLTKLAGTPAAEGLASATPTENSWTAEVGTFEVRGASINFQDQAVSPAVQLALSSLNMTIGGYSTAAAKPAEIKLDAAIGDATVSADGDFSLDPPAANLAVEIARLDLPSLQPYLPTARSLNIGSGRLSLKASAHAAEARDKRQPQISVSGELSVDDFKTKEIAAGQDFVHWETLRLNGLEYTATPDTLKIASIELLRPYGRVMISEDQKVNITSVLSSPGSASAPPAPSTPMAVSIGRVTIEDGSSDFTDYSVEPNFAAAILGLNGTVTGLSSESRTRADVKLTGSVDRYAPVDITGRVNLLSAAMFTDIAMRFRNMELTTFNPYSGKYAGYSISKGKLTTELQYKVENRMLDAQHHIVLDQLEFGGATESKDKVPLPVRLAAALLKDRQGVIDIEVPVTGSLDDPEFRVGPLIWKAFVGLLTRVVTAPFALLGSLFGGGDDLAYIDFASGSAALTAEQQEKISSLTRALIERPQLRLDVPLQTLVEADTDAITQQRLDAAVAAAGEDRLAALAQVYRQQMGAEAAYPSDVIAENIAFLENALRPRFAPTEAEKAQLARQRADAVQDALLVNPEVAPERVFLTERLSGETAVPGTARMELRLD